MQKPNAKSINDYLTLAALERQRLGLSPSEYYALTPLQVKCELEALKIIAQEKTNALLALDEHLARIEMLLNGYNFPNVKSVDEFRILKRSKAKESSKQNQRANTIKNVKMALRMRQTVERLRLERDTKRAERIKTGSKY